MKKIDNKFKIINLSRFPVLLFLLFILIIISLSLFFIFHTLDDALEEGMQRGLETTNRQYREREMDLAQEGVDKLVEGISHAVETSELPGDILKEEILEMLEREVLGKGAHRGFFLFDEENVCRVNYDFPEVVGKHIDELAVSDAVLELSHSFTELREGSVPRFFEFTISPERVNLPERTKYVYIAHVREWDWIVGAGFYLEGANGLIAEQNRVWNDVEDSIEKNMVGRVISLALFIFLIMTGGAIYLLWSQISKEKLQSRFRSFEKTLDDKLCILFTDSKGIISRVNDRYCAITGRSRESLIGRPSLIVEDMDLSAEQREDITDKMTRGENWYGLIKGMDRGGSNFWLQTQIGPVRDGKGEIKGYVSLAMDVTELNRKRYELEKSLYSDTLTGLGNRRKMLSVYQHERDFFVAMYNIDNFGSINRFYGMDEGDRILIKTADTISLMLNKSHETLYRISGDTFVILSKETDPVVFIEKSRNRWELLNGLIFKISGTSMPVSFRLGLSTCSADPLVVAESALTAAKRSSDGIVHYGDSEPDEPGMEELEKLNSLRLALDRSDVFMVFQPIMDLRTGEIGKYECLVRMRDSKGRILNPGNFINLAKKGRLYKRITHLVIEQSFEAFRDRTEDFSINLTIEDFMDRETIGYLEKQAALNNISERLIVEIVESEELRNFDEVVGIISLLKSRGIRIAIDDFGSGFSNFNYLLRLNADYIKIDGSLIKNILTDEKSRSLVASIIQFAEKAGMETIAEYIESEEIEYFVRKAGVCYAQGYHIGKPARSFKEVESA